jgi:hypothetical protein
MAKFKVYVGKWEEGHVHEIEAKNKHDAFDKGSQIAKEKDIVEIFEVMNDDVAKRVYDIINGFRK